MIPNQPTPEAVPSFLPTPPTWDRQIPSGIPQGPSPFAPVSGPVAASHPAVAEPTPSPIQADNRVSGMPQPPHQPVGRSPFVGVAAPRSPRQVPEVPASLERPPQIPHTAGFPTAPAPSGNGSVLASVVPPAQMTPEPATPAPAVVTAAPIQPSKPAGPKRHHQNMEEMRRLSKLAGALPLEEALGEIIRSGVRSLGLRRGSAWIFSEDCQQMRCVMAVEDGQPVDVSRFVLPTSAVPNYMAALQAECLLEIPEALTDLRSKEWAVPYLEPFEVCSLLEVPVRVEGELAAVLKFEGLGTMRLWSFEDANLGIALGGIAAQAISAERRKKEAAEHTQTLSLLNATLDSTGDGILVLDAKGAIIGLNDQLLRMWNLPTENTLSDTELLRGILDGMVNPKAFLDRVQQLQSAPQAESEDMLETKGGRHLECISRPQKLDGKIVGRIWCFRDRTERQRSEKERESLQAQLQQAQKLEALGTLAGGVAHDFNNVLMAILGHAELATMALEPTHPAVADLNEIQHAGQRAGELIKRILAFGRKSAPVVGNVALGPLLEETVKLLRATLPASIEIHCELPTKPLAIIGDASQLHQALMNLCTNAAQAMKSTNGGTLSLRAVTEYISPEVAAAFPGLNAGNCVHLTVRDTGCGMDAATIDRIFDPFFTTKKNEGSGLGLSVVHGIVRSHGGIITVESTLGEGSAFHLYLPAVAPEEEKHSQPSSHTAQSVQGQGEHILLIEDEAAVSEFLRRSLTSLGYHVAAFNHPQEAMEVLRLKARGAFDVVITDFNMPKLSGLDVACETQRIVPEMPIILMTGYEDPVSPEDAQRYGIRRVLTKPLTTHDLARSIREVIAQRPALPA